MRKNSIKLIPVLGAIMILASCSRAGKEYPGRIYMPDMTYSNAYETYSTSEITTPEGNNMSARKPVEGTIPYGYIPSDEKIKTNQSLLMSYVMKNHFSYDVAKQDAERVRAASEIQDPLEHTAASLAEGKRLYDINCTPCHGEKGEGNGQLIELPGGGDGPFTSRPQPYKTLLPTLKDGAIFYSVSYGKNMMGGYGFQLSVNERWQVIQYIKKLGGIGEVAVASSDTSSTKK
ncbi:MAG: c-type cytochrome [Bacteroidota bacterium]